MTPERELEMRSPPRMSPSGILFRVYDARQEAQQLKKQSTMKLAQAQYVVAQSYGYSSWSHLVNDWRA